ncbi:MAG: D-alanyl-D-alanine carboxypeptidase/D-alanyl-D-alanine-endopeptidase [Candidatus Eremiobacteraeota bacterium]|nr:D-alanyl-D-alanine carboxypeptidase/D-alanyl-D-alanine-endopeptidase [Candidatus Eremiobacteraeota bacterium]
MFSPRGASIAIAPAVAHATPVPAPPWTPQQVRSLGTAMRGAFAPALAGADAWSLVVLSADGKTLYADNADRAVTPASALKLIVAATALDVLGPQFRYRTSFAAQQPIGTDGTLDGNLWLVGSGDPSLRSPDLQRGVDALVAGGLRTIRGGVAVDAAAVRGPEYNPHWDLDDATEDYAAPTSGVSLDEDTAEFDVSGATPGEPAVVSVIPPNDVVRVDGSIGTSNGTDDVVIAAQSAPNHFHLDGYIPAGARERDWLPVHGIAAYVGNVLQHMLEERGIELAAAPSTSLAPLDSISLWDRRSAPLRVLETHMLVHSDNHYAEQLLRTVGGEAGDAPDDAGGIAAEKRFLSERGVPTPGLQLYDGSGLAPADRVAAVTLATILADAQLRGGNASLYLLLPQGGRQGTLRAYDFTTALGRVRAKSGHIGGVSSLAGYVNTYDHGRVIFAFLVNGSPGNPDAAIVRAVNRLAVF